MSFIKLAGQLLLSLVVITGLPKAAASVSLGNTGVGSSLDSEDGNYLNGIRLNTGSSGFTVTSASARIGNVDASPNNKYQLALYADNNGVPGALVAVSAVGTLTANSWNTASLSASLQAQTYYWLVYNTNGVSSSGNCIYYNSSGSQAVFSNGSVPFGTWPTAFGGATVTSVAYSLYLTGDPTGAGAPSVSITSPLPSQTVSGTTTVNATASIAAGVAGVQFKIDGTNLGAEDTTSPYSVSWDTTSASNDVHSITATARGTDGTLVTSSPVSVTVQNGGAPSDVGQWAALQTWPIVAIHSTMLSTGKVLVFDEEYKTTHPLIWDPATQTLTSTPSTPFELWCCGQIQLANGNILTAGGHLVDTNQGGTKVIYQYDPVANTWTRGSDMAFSRWYPALNRLSDGRIVILSGQITVGVYADQVEIFDPSTSALSILPNVDTVEIQEEEYPDDFLLPTGQVLAISPQLGPVQLLDVGAATWTRVNVTPIPLGTAVQYRPGKIMMSGGGAAFSATSSTATAVLDMTVPSPAWRPTAPMTAGRYMHDLVMLPTGDVLAIGGSGIAYQQATTGPLTAERWNPVSETWSPLAAMAVPRMYHSSALLLPDGRVLSAGGGHNGAAPDMLSAQVYSPPYLFRGARPTIGSAPSAVAYGAVFSVGCPTATDIVSISLIGLGASTHATDVDQSYRELSFTKTATQLSITAPTDSRAAPPGYYMLFLVNSAGVPSVAKMISIGGTGSGGDTTPPTITSTSPLNGATGIAVSTTATATFSEPLDPTSVTAAAFTLRTSGNVSVAGIVSYDNTTFTATFTPSAALPANTAITATVVGGTGGVRDVAGNPLAANAVWTFTTGNSAGSGTVGSTSIGSTIDSGCSNFLNGSLVTTSTGGAIKSVSVYVGPIDSSSTNRSFQLAIYTDNGGKPGTRVAATAVGTLVGNAWNTLSITASLNSSTNYWLVYNTNGRSDPVNDMAYSNGANGKGVFSTSKVTFGSMPATFPASATTGAVYSLYATFGP